MSTISAHADTFNADGLLIGCNRFQSNCTHELPPSRFPDDADAFMADAAREVAADTIRADMAAALARLQAACPKGTEPVVHADHVMRADRFYVRYSAMIAKMYPNCDAIGHGASDKSLDAAVDECLAEVAARVAAPRLAV